MSIQRQERRGTRAENDAFTGAEGEFIYITDEKRGSFHDGSALGGVLLPNRADIQNNSFNYSNAGGTATVMTCSTDQNPSALVEGMSVMLKMASDASSGGTTLQWGSTSAQDVKILVDGTKTDPATDQWKASDYVEFFYDGTDWVALISGASGGVNLVSSTLVTGSPTTLDFSSVFELGKSYLVELTGVDYSANGADIQMRVERSGSFQSGNNYNRAMDRKGSATGFTGFYEENQNSVEFVTNLQGPTGGAGFHALMSFFSPADSATMARGVSSSVYESGTNNIEGISGSWGERVAGAVTGFQIFSDTAGTFNNVGVINIYEMKR